MVVLGSGGAWCGAETVSMVATLDLLFLSCWVAHPPPPYACLSRVSFGILHDIRFHTVTIAQRSVQLEQAL